MTLARQTFCGWCADFCRWLGRKSMFLPKLFDRAADWFLERSR